MIKCIVVVKEEYVRDAQRFNGKESCDNIHDSEEWVDVFGDVIVGTFKAKDSKEFESEKQRFYKFYPKHTLSFIYN